MTDDESMDKRDWYPFIYKCDGCKYGPCYMKNTKVINNKYCRRVKSHTKKQKTKDDMIEKLRTNRSNLRTKKDFKKCYLSQDDIPDLRHGDAVSICHGCPHGKSGKCKHQVFNII